MKLPYIPAGGAFLVEETPQEALFTPERLDGEALRMANAAADFLRGEVLPVADCLQAEGPTRMPDLLRRAAALGLLAIDVPEEYGGLGLPKSVSVRLAEALAAEPSFSVSHNVHTSVATLPLLLFGTPEQKARYLPRLASGEWIGAYALSEAHAGSDALAARTRATLSADGAHYLLFGEKMWITNAAFADLFTVFAKTDAGQFTAFLVERRFPGVSIGREEHKLGLKGSSTCRLILDNAPVPVENVLGEVGQGAKAALYTLNIGRFKIAASSVGQSKNLLGIAVRYAKQRQAFGKPLAEFGLIQEKLATMAARLFAAESMLYRVAGYLDGAFAGIDPVSTEANSRSQAAAAEYAIECALLKVACTETLDYIADETLQIHGGYGYTEEFPAARAWRDARVNRIYEGTNEINRLNATELLLKRIAAGQLNLSSSQSTQSATGEAYRLQAACGSTLQAALDACADLPKRQELCVRCADMLLALFASQSVQARRQNAGDFGTSARAQAAQDAEGLFSAEALQSARACASSILAACGEPGRSLWECLAPTLEADFSDGTPLRERLAKAAIEAEGYPW